MLTLIFQDQPHRAFTHFRGKLVRCLAHDAPPYSGVGVSGKPGAVQTNPLNDDDMAEFVALQHGFVTGPKSWIVDVADVDAATFDLSAKNPNAPEADALRSPEAIIDTILARDAETAEILERIRGLL